MKKIIKLFLLSISLFTSISVTSAFFKTGTDIISVFNTRGYEVKINANGGTFDNTLSVVGTNAILPTPSRTGYTFLGYSNNSNGSIDYTAGGNNIDNINENGIYAVWSVNSYTVDVNSIIDGVRYDSGLSGFTFDVWVDGVLVADDVIDWCQSVNHGSTVRVKSNNATGRNTSYDWTATIGTSTIYLYPSWTTNTYQSDFYLNGGYITSTYNKYGATISTPNLTASSLGYNSNFYYLSGYTPYTTWTQPDYTVGFSIDIAEYVCTATFGSRSVANANAQLSKLQNAGYDFCYVSGTGIGCTSNYSAVQAIYNNGWNILPRSGSGYSIYKSMGCNSGWSIVETR